MKLNIIAVGSLTKQYLDLYNSYTKKIQPFCSINLIEIKEQNIDNIELKKKRNQTYFRKDSQKLKSLLFINSWKKDR